MTTLKRKCHLQALSENLELGLIGGLLASSVDSLWVIMDMIHNGVHWYYIIILLGLLTSTLAIAIALQRHHVNNVKQQIGIIYRAKKELLHRKLKHGRK